MQVSPNLCSPTWGRRRYVATGETASAADGLGTDRVGAVALWCVGVSWRAVADGVRAVAGVGAASA